MEPVHYTLTPEDFLSRKERATLMKVCRERSELDLMKGRQTWPIRYTLVDLALYSGLRVGELVALKIEDLYLEEKDPYIIVRQGKGKKERTVYIDNKLCKHLQWFLTYKDKSLHQSVTQDAPLFSGHGGNHSPTITLMKSFKSAIHAAGLRERLSIHKARHTYASFLLQSTRNLKYVQKQLGHQDITMTSLYAHILPEDNGILANSISRDDE